MRQGGAGTGCATGCAEAARKHGQQTPLSSGYTATVAWKVSSSGANTAIAVQEANREYQERALARAARRVWPPRAGVEGASGRRQRAARAPGVRHAPRSPGAGSCANRSDSSRGAGLAVDGSSRAQKSISLARAPSRRSSVGGSARHTRCASALPRPVFTHRARHIVRIERRNQRLAPTQHRAARSHRRDERLQLV